jgi:TIR domain
MSDTIFICHARADNVRCDPYVTALRTRGLDVYYQPSIDQFGQLPPEIYNELERCSVMVVLLTQNAVESFWVKQEMKSFLDLMERDKDRRLLLVPIAPCHVQAGEQPNVQVLDVVGMTSEAAAGLIATALGKSTFVTDPIPTVVSRTPGMPRLSRRALLIGGGSIGAIALGGGAVWVLRSLQGVQAATPANLANTPDPGTPKLIWTPVSGQPLTLPLHNLRPTTTIDLNEYYRVDTTFGRFDLDNGNDQDLSCVASGVPLIFGSHSQPGKYFVAVPKCMDADRDPSTNTTGPKSLSSLVLAYTFGYKGATGPCIPQSDGNNTCLPRQKPNYIAQVSDDAAYNTVSGYYNAIRTGDYHTAYQMLAYASQQRQTFDAFQQYWGIGPITLLPDFSQVGQNGDGSVALNLSYTQTLADGVSFWRSTVVVQVEASVYTVLPLGRIKIINPPTPTPGPQTPGATPDPTPKV